jgi:peptidoglycan/LPS O-acetylase OafA/YrhL
MPVTGNTEHTRPENRAFYPALDGLRAIAFLMVFVQHYMSFPWGWAGVNVFFVLSGFLITGILFDTRNAPHRARNFYVRRTLRIFPLYYGIFLAVLLTTPLFHWAWTRAWLAWPLYGGNLLHYVSPAFSVPGSARRLAADAQLQSLRWPAIFLFFGHFWSLCVEEQFYLFWPWVVFWLRSRRVLLWICGVTVVAMPLARMVAAHSAPSWMLGELLLYRTIPFQLDALLLGGLVALLLRGAYRHHLLRAGMWVAVLCTVLAVVYLARTVHLRDPSWMADYQYPAWRLTWGLSFVNVFTAAMILCCIRPGGWLVRALSLRPLRWLGRISYGAYVFHDILHLEFIYATAALARRSSFVYRHGTYMLPLMAMAATLMIATLSFRFFESPFLDLKERWTVRG